MIPPPFIIAFSPLPGEAEKIDPIITPYAAADSCPPSMRGAIVRINIETGPSAPTGLPGALFRARVPERVGVEIMIPEKFLWLFGLLSVGCMWEYVSGQSLMRLISLV